jgi:hypothetical protein
MPTPPTSITPDVITDQGKTLTAAAACDATNGNQVRNTHSLQLTLKNTDASSATVVFTTPGTVGGFAVEDYTVTLAAGDSKVFGGFDAAVFGGTLVFKASTASVTFQATVV